MTTLREDLAIGPADTQQAFDGATRYEFMGHRLEPWTVRRHSVALQLRSRLMRGMNDENNSVSQFLADGFYPHVYHDLVVILYLMHLDKTAVLELERLNEINAMEQIYSWAEAIPLNYGTEPFFEAAKIMGKLLHSIHVSWFQVKKQDSSEKKIPIPEPIVPHGNSNSSMEQSGQADSTPITA